MTISTPGEEHLGATGIVTFMGVNSAIGFVSHATEMLMASWWAMFMAIASSVMGLWHIDDLDLCTATMIVI